MALTKEPSRLRSIPPSTMVDCGFCSSPSAEHAHRRLARVRRGEDVHGVGTPSLDGGRTSLSYDRDPGARLLDPACELEVLKCIMLREGYLTRVTLLAEGVVRKAKKSQGQLQTLPAGLIDLLDLLRIVTLDTVEAISIWRLSQAEPTPRPFQWNGDNYLIKMLHDSDFLDRIEAVRRWFGFPLNRNPLFFPPRSNSDTDTQIDNEIGDTVKSFTFDKTGLADLGQQPWLGPLEVPVGHQQDQGNGATKTRLKQRTARKSEKGASPGILALYAAPIVNDPSLLPIPTSPPRAGSTTVDPVRGKTAGALMPTVDTRGLVPNLVSRDDIVRVVAANRALVEEEMRVSGTGVLSRSAGEVRSVTDGGQENSPTRRKEFRPSLSEEGRTRGKRPFQPAARDVDIRHGKRSILAWLLDPDAVNKPRLTSGGKGYESSLSQTAARLLQRPRPDPHPALGPILLCSDHPGGDMHPKPFFRTVAQSTVGCTSAYAARPETTATDGPRANVETRKPPAKTTDSDNRWAEAWQTAGAPSGSSLNLSRAVSAPSPPTFAATATVTENNPVIRSTPAVLGSFYCAQIGGDSGRHYASRALQKAGAELRALTAAGTTGRRNPPPREVRLRRLARDIARHSAELRELKLAEEGLHWDLGRLENKHTAPSPRESTTSRTGTLVQITNTGGDVDLADEDPEDKSIYDKKEPHETVTEGMMGTSDETNHNSTMRDRAAAEPIELSSRRSGQECSKELTTENDCSRGNVSLYSDALVSQEATSEAKQNVRAMLKEKRREIDLKIFDFAVKREELACLHAVQRQERERKQGLELERRRARLGHGQSLPEDDIVAETLEDRSAIAVQRRCRGSWARKYAAWYKKGIQQAATVIQRGVRCAWDRRATARRLLLHTSARPIQAAIRMFVKRKRYTRLLRLTEELFACRKLQRVCRGVRGRRRAAARRSMIAAARKAAYWVSLQNLQPKHLKELARAIHGALIDPLRPLPPPGVLGALRVALTILDGTGVEHGGNGKGETVTFQTALGRTVRGAVSAPELTWEMAARVLGRPLRLLRRMRAFASGLGAAFDPAPIRLLRLPRQAVELLAGYREDPAWSDEALTAVSAGGKTAMAFVGWARELGRVYDEQPHVQGFLKDAQPAWLRKSRSLQRHRRALELLAESSRSAVTVARNHLDEVKARGCAYGDRLLAVRVLEERLECAENALLGLKNKGEAFVERQAETEAAEGRAQKEDAEFAEREASVAARAESMARRTGLGGAEALADCERKTRDCQVVLREMKRLVRVWEKKCREDSRPLLGEWVPPTEKNFYLARSLGGARAWVEILLVQKARIVEQAGGPQFLKGLTREKLEAWMRVSEGLQACRADVESGEARIADCVRRFDLEVATANEETATRKVCSTPWDNATDETKKEELEEDRDAAIEESRTAMGATLPLGFLDKVHDPPRRPTLVLLGLDLPAAVRTGIRSRLDNDVPELFGLHLSGEDALPSVAAAIQRRGRGFLGSSLEPGSSSPSSQHGGPAAGVHDMAMMEAYVNQVDMNGVACDRVFGVKQGDGLQRVGHIETKQNRTDRVQTALSTGKSVSLDVLPGPGLWTHGRFLRDLEALLQGLDGCGGQVDSTTDKAAVGPTVVLVRGHIGNRSGGGADIWHGTKAAVVDEIPHANGHEMESRAAAALAAVGPRRIKCLLEAAAQCLHDLNVRHGEELNPFAEPSDLYPSPTSTSATADKQPKKADTLIASRGDPSPQCQTPGLDVLLAACQILLQPFCRYLMTEDEQEDNTRVSTRPEPSGTAIATAEFLSGKTRRRAYISDLAAVCRRQLAQTQSTKKMADVLQQIDLTSVPFETAVALRELVRQPDWPSTSPRPSFAGCCALEAFSGWIIAAVNAAISLSLTEGGVDDGSQGIAGKSVHASARKSSCSRSWSGKHVATNAQSWGNRGAFEDPAPSHGGYESARIREQELLHNLQRLIVHEEISVVDDDNPWFPGSREGEERVVAKKIRYCHASEAFDAMVDIILRPLQVHEEAERVVPHADNVGSARTSEQSMSLDHRLAGEKFKISVNRAFGSVYVRAVPLDSGLRGGSRALTTRVRDDGLIRLLSPNWMEKHDLNGIKELSSSPAVWKALVDTLVLQGPHRTPQWEIDVNERKPPDRQAESEPRGPVIECNGQKPSFDLWVLCFRHSRRLALTTTCLLRGHAAHVAMYEECRNEFWCEARVPVALAGRGVYTTVGRSVPKECIPLILDDDHPMHMRTTLNASDIRELCVFIADRLQLRSMSSSVESIRRPYRGWLDVGGGCGSSIEPSTDHVQEIWPTNPGGRQAFCLSLRKRGVGQVVFARLVSFWIPVDSRGVSLGGEACNNSDLARCMTRSRKLVIIKEISHRGALGELQVELHDPESSVRVPRFTLPRDLTHMLLTGRRAELMANSGAEHDRPVTALSESGVKTHLLTQYWRNALSWRLTMSQVAGITKNDFDTAAAAPRPITTTKLSSLGCGVGGCQHVQVDQRKPMFALPSVAVRTTPSSMEHGCNLPSSMRKEFFDLLLLPSEANLPARKTMNALEFVLTHCQAMISFRFTISISTLVKAVSGLARACLTVPASLSTERVSPASGLRKLVGEWLCFSLSGWDGALGRLTITIPGADPVHTYPYSGLCGVISGHVLGSDKLSTPRQRVEAGANVAPTSNTRDIQQRASDDVVAEKLSRSDSRAIEQRMTSDDAVPRPVQTQLASVAALAVETRNERMVFFRKITVPPLQESGGRHGPASVVSQDLMISVYEAFATGEDGRVVRSLKFCARDETVRPALEARASIPWVGSSAGVEGGAVWQIATQSLRFQRLRSERGTVIGMKLETLVPHGVGSSKRGNRSFLKGGEEAKGATCSRKSVEFAPSECKTQHKIELEGSRACITAVGNHALTSNFQGAQQAALAAGSIKIYDDWHSVSGVRLHVQCFQQHECDTQNINGSEWQRPAGRGGVSSLPRAASLRFLVRNPRGGQQSETQISTDDIYRSSSLHGGILPDDLLNAGRRPALAREIAKKFRLVFEPDGGYHVTMPLPTVWVRV